MPIINIRNAALPPSSRGLVAVGSLGVPRFWATIWSDVLNPRLEPSSRQMDRTMLYTAITRGIETVVLVGDLDYINEICSQRRWRGRTDWSSTPRPPQRDEAAFD